MTYQEALDWIHSKLKLGSKPGTKRVDWLLEQFGNPQKELKAIHVVGTNGKGSTTAYLQHIFTTSGYKVGTFTSPYIVDFRERIAIDGQMMPQDDLVALVELLKPVVERLDQATPYTQATEFEIITVMMFLYFTRINPVDIAIVEAGLGGLSDATNTFEALAVVCPSIGLDHQDLLGETYAEIAQQKVAVVKNGEPFIFATDKAEVRRVFESHCQKVSSPLFELGRAFSITTGNHCFDFTYQDTNLTNISLAMLGKHQHQNASLAIMTSLLLQDIYPKLSEASIIQGLSDTKWVGRTEFLRSNLMIDGAHNNESVAVLVDLLQEDFPDRKIHVLFAAINTKPVETMLDQLNQFDSLTVTTFDYPKSLGFDQYPKNYPYLANYQEWLQEYDQPGNDDLLVITGSLYFISQVRQGILEMMEEKKPC